MSLMSYIVSEVLMDNNKTPKLEDIGRYLVKLLLLKHGEKEDPERSYDLAT